MKMYTLAIIFAISFLFSEEVTKITIIHSNDLHGHVLPFDIAGQKNVGGMSPRMTYIRKLRHKIEKQNEHLLLLDGGDLNTGDPFSDMLNGEPGIKAMNLMKYNAMAVGNHEFDLRLEKLFEQKKMADFPYLSANVVYTDTGELLFKPYIILQKGNIKIGIIGMTTDDTPIVSTYGNDPRIKFLKHEDVLPKIIKELRPRVDYLIGLFHISLHTVVDLAEKFPGLDMILGGHSHIVTSKPIKVNNTIIIEAGSYGLLLGKFNLTFVNKKIISWKHQNIAINLSSPILSRWNKQIGCYPSKKILSLDKEIEKKFHPYHQKIDKLLNEPLGIAKRNFRRGGRSYPKSSALGNLISDSLRERAKSDIALHNVGGIRSDLLRGKITYRDVRRILPFSNTLFIYTITGQEVLNILNLMANFDVNTGRYFEVSGINFCIENKKATNVNIGNKPIKKDKKYTLAINSFIAGGGDGFSIFKKFTNKVDSGFFLSDILVDYIRKNKMLVMDKSKRFYWK